MTGLCLPVYLHLPWPQLQITPESTLGWASRWLKQTKFHPHKPDVSRDIYLPKLFQSQPASDAAVQKLHDCVDNADRCLMQFLRVKVRMTYTALGLTLEGSVSLRPEQCHVMLDRCSLFGLQDIAGGNHIPSTLSTFVSWHSCSSFRAGMLGFNVSQFEGTRALA